MLTSAEVSNESALSFFFLVTVSNLLIIISRKKNISSGDELHEKNSRTHLDRLQNKYTNCEGVKNNCNFGQITGIQDKLDTTCKQNTS
jgi:hypothetical protein